MATKCKTSVSVAVFLATASIIPLYNKMVFSGFGHPGHGFPYPLMVTFMQLGLCAVLLTILSITREAWYRLTARGGSTLPSSNDMTSNRRPDVTSSLDRNYGSMIPEDIDVCANPIDAVMEKGSSRSGSSSSSSSSSTRRSWIFGPHFGYKLWHTLPIGVFFGLKFGVTNWGLKLLSLPTPMLLHSTDLMWTVLFAHLFNKEFLTRYEAVCCLLSLFGTALVALRVQEEYDFPIFPVAINLLSPVLLGLCVSTLRLVTQRLLVNDNAHGLRFQNMDAFELTAIKLWISSIVILPFSLLIEGQMVNSFRSSALPKIPPVWDALFVQPDVFLVSLALGGGVLIMIFQTNITYLATHTTAVTLGVVGGLKIFPQWTLALLFKGALDVSSVNLSGAVIVLLSSLAWTAIKVRALSTTNPLTNVDAASEETETLFKRNVR
jgi:hypothetical protein